MINSQGSACSKTEGPEKQKRENRNRSIVKKNNERKIPRIEEQECSQ